MEVIAGSTKYFLTPSNNIVSGVPNNGKIEDARLYVNKKNQYNTPVELNKLMKERSDLAAGRIALSEIQRPNFAEYNIPLDAGKKKRNPKKSKMAAGAQPFTPIVEDAAIEAGKKKKKTPSVKSVKSKKSKGKRNDAILGGAPSEEKKTSLADLFKQVSLHLAHQASDLIAEGGNPHEQLRDNIKFFSKR